LEDRSRETPVTAEARLPKIHATLLITNRQYPRSSLAAQDFKISLRGSSIIQLGLLLLLVTSIARVAYVVYAFRVKRIGSIPQSP